jgi:hypothetical protein
MGDLNLPFWGESSFIFDQLPEKQWHIVSANSFEDRCLSLPLILKKSKLSVKGWSVLAITNPPSLHWQNSLPKLAGNLATLKKLTSDSDLDLMEIELDSIFPWSKVLADLNEKKSKSVILDISCMPKRHFLFCLRRLIESPVVEDLVVTYSIANSYPEKPLFEDIQPECSIPGFMREPSDFSNSLSGKVFISVGYTPRGLDSVMSSSGMSDVELVFPFPPGSPAFRKNWKFLSDIALPSQPKLEIHMIHSLDSFEVCSRLIQWVENKKISWYAYGSKPHTLGAALAYMKAPDRIELRYSQPRVYNHEYSSGIKTSSDDTPLTYCYCLKVGSTKLF